MTGLTHWAIVKRHVWVSWEIPLDKISGSIAIRRQGDEEEGASQKMNGDVHWPQGLAWGVLTSHPVGMGRNYSNEEAKEIRKRGLIGNK